MNTYDASGTKRSTDHTYYNHGSHNQNIIYVNGIELIGNGEFIVFHEEGRYISNDYVDEENKKYEYVISDHLGSGRVWFQDFDGDGMLSLNPANLEVKQIKHYYSRRDFNGQERPLLAQPNPAELRDPFGMTMGIQSLQSYAPPTDRNQYNGIEFFEGLDYNMAFYRTLDPGIGRWLQVDPKAEAFYSLSTYNSMGNNPISNTDPNGDFIESMVASAAISVVANGVSNWIAGDHFFKGAGRATIMGALSGGMSSLIGTATSTASGLLGAGLQAYGHGFTGGVSSALSGGSFGHGAISGAFSSGAAYGIDELGGNAFHQILGGSVTGGLSGWAAGGNFVDGFAQGLITSGLNHAAHGIQDIFKANLKKPDIREIFEAYIRAREEGRAHDMFNFIKDNYYGSMSILRGRGIENQLIKLDGHSYKLNAYDKSPGRPNDFFNVADAGWAWLIYENGVPLKSYQGYYSGGWRVKNYYGDNLLSIGARGQVSYDYLRRVYQEIESKY